MKSPSLVSSSVVRRMAAFFVGTILLVEFNVLAFRHPVRKSFGRSERYELPTATADFFHGARRELKLTGFVIRGESAAPVLTAALEALRLEGVSVTILDPERERARYLEAIGDLVPLADSPIGVVEGPHRRVLVDQASATMTFASIIESFETSATRVLEETPQTLCFTTGHGERDPFDSAPGGLSAFRGILTSTGADVRPWEVLQETSEGCNTIVVAGLTEPFSREEAEALTHVAPHRAGLALFLDPVLDVSGRVLRTGLEELAKNEGIEPQNSVVLEPNDSERPSGQPPETLFATPSSHPLAHTERNERPIFQFVRALELGTGSTAQVLFRSSQSSEVLVRLRGDAPALPMTNGAILATALERPPGAEGPARVLVFGTSSVIDNVHLEKTSATGNLVLARRIAAFLTNRPVTQAQKPRATAPRVEWSEGDRMRISVLALGVLPLTLALFGATYLYREYRRRGTA